MDNDALRKLLSELRTGQISVEEAVAALSRSGIDPLEFANVDLDRARRRGLPEVVFGPGKTTTQICGIAKSLREAQQRLLVTRVDESIATEVIGALPNYGFEYDKTARCLYSAPIPDPSFGRGKILVVTAGTSDIPVAMEAVLTIRHAGHPVDTLFDIGVAGLHRLLANLEVLRSAEVLIVCAGMEGALPSVIAGLVSQPVIAVPTSVGYGAHLEGVTPLLAMMSGCAAGVTVVNIDNGFGAAYAACAINRSGAERAKT